MNTDSLNKEDVASLEKETSITNKSLIAKKVGTYYGNPAISPQAAKLAEDIFRIMVRDTETKVREALSNSLKNCQNLPQDIVQSIIEDKDSISIPFIQYYQSLTNEDLIKILNMPSINRQKAVAQRSNLPSPITQYIAEHCSDKVIGEMISNDSADIKEETFNIIINKYSDDEDIKKRLVYRSVLPVSVIEKIVDKLSLVLKSYLVLHHNLTKNLASDIVEDVKEKITLNISEQYSSDAQIEDLVKQLYKADKLTSGLVVRSICLGDLKFFEYAIAYLSETPVAEVRKILFNMKADFMIRNLLRKAFIPKNMFSTVLSALKVINEIRFDCDKSNRKLFGHKVIERILSYNKNNEDLSEEDIKFLISKIN